MGGWRLRLEVRTAWVGAPGQALPPVEAERRSARPSRRLRSGHARRPPGPRPGPTRRRLRRSRRRGRVDRGGRRGRRRRNSSPREASVEGAADSATDSLADAAALIDASWRGRPPAAPLFVRNPYLNVWSAADSVSGAWPTLGWRDSRDVGHRAGGRYPVPAHRPGRPLRSRAARVRDDPPLVVDDPDQHRVRARRRRSGPSRSTSCPPSRLGT